MNQTTYKDSAFNLSSSSDLYSIPRCKSCNSIYSLISLNNIGICNDCLDASSIGDELNASKEELNKAAEFVEELIEEKGELEKEKEKLEEKIDLYKQQLAAFKEQLLVTLKDLNTKNQSNKNLLNNASK